jgi:hypothetical protein
MATKIRCGWIKKGVDKPIVTTASRTRVNIIDAIYLNAISHFFAKLKEGYPQAEKLYIILDQSDYNRSHAVK